MFFALSVGIILFFFLARVALVALVAAAIMTAIFHVVRRIRRSFSDHHPAYDEWRGLPHRYEQEPLFYERPRQHEKLEDIQYIRVH